MMQKLSRTTIKAIDSSLWRREEEGLRCLICARSCLLKEGSTGFCTAIVHEQGQLFSTAYGVVSEATVTPIENRPVYHYRPGTHTLSLGGLGCNLRCGFCQNWEVAFRDARHGGGLPQPNLAPERAVELALEQRCEGLAWTFNEPTISPMYLLDCARQSHEAGLYTVLVTNGLMTHEVLDMIGPFIDVYRVDVKSMDQVFYQRVAHTSRILDILPVARRAQHEYGIHVETVTNLMPGLNDSDEHLKRLAQAILTHLGENTPWHLSTYVPYANMTHIAPTPPATLDRARTIGIRTGLRFVYTDDISTPGTANTICPTCGECVIERKAHQVRLLGLAQDGTCARCHASLGMILATSFTSLQKEDLV
ncbi:MAG: AmmeMemoRadiSam system radical SAM enzyme [Ktedonobacteraceae bacterium]